MSDYHVRVDALVTASRNTGPLKPSLPLCESVPRPDNGNGPCRGGLVFLKEGITSFESFWLHRKSRDFDVWVLQKPAQGVRVKERSGLELEDSQLTLPGDFYNASAAYMTFSGEEMATIDSGWLFVEPRPQHACSTSFLHPLTWRMARHRPDRRCFQPGDRHLSCDVHCGWVGHLDSCSGAATLRCTQSDPERG